MTTLGHTSVSDGMWMSASISQIPITNTSKVHASILNQTKVASALAINSAPVAAVQPQQSTTLLRTPAHASLPGGYSVGVPPDPIPNSAVKPDCANGTIAQAMEE